MKPLDIYGFVNCYKVSKIWRVTVGNGIGMSFIIINPNRNGKITFIIDCLINHGMVVDYSSKFPPEKIEMKFNWIFRPVDNISNHLVEFNLSPLQVIKIKKMLNDK